MANKIYDFLPAHLRNKELEDYFDATLERAFSKGKVEKTRAFIGRKEKGIYSDKDAYVSFPEHLFQRDNYGLEPVYTNPTTTDNVFYDDLLNAMFNKGLLTNDHRRLFRANIDTVNLPVDADKFVNYELYYWVRPGFFTDDRQSGTNLHYVTIEKSTGNWWGENNAWYHYDDIREEITKDNQHLIQQAKRPIIEFDDGLELSDFSLTATEWAEPTFRIFNSNNEYIADTKLFHYVTGSEFPLDLYLNLNAKRKAGDYTSEFVFNIDIPNGASFRFDGAYIPLYIKSEFEYRNLRHEVGNGTFSEYELSQAPIDNNAIDVYIDGVKTVEGYTFNSSTNKVTFTNPITGYVYIDIATKDNVVVDGDNVWQRIDPTLEYNIDNKDYENVELTHSFVFEHFFRLIETTPGLTGNANSYNNFRKLGDNKDKTRFNKFGSVIIKNGIDVKNGYFAITREDYDPIKAVEFLSSSYSSYKNKFITTVRELLDQPGSPSKSNRLILEEAIRNIALSKRSDINVFSASKMLNMGELNSHYIEGAANVTVGGKEHFLPNNMQNIIITDADELKLNVYLNDEIQMLGEDGDYTISDTGNEILFNTYVAQEGDKVDVRFYKNLEETFIPPSAVNMKIAPLYFPGLITDHYYETPQEFVRGHDGSLMPSWGDRTDEIVLEFEKLIYNRIENKNQKDIKMREYSLSRDATTEYSLQEKKYLLYPFFKKWMIKNNINNLYNSSYSKTDYKTWNYRGANDLSPGHWRGLMQYVYGTDRPSVEPWVTVGFSKRPKIEEQPQYDENNPNGNVDIFDGDYSTHAFWNELKTAYSKTWVEPIDVNTGQLKTPNELFFNNQITPEQIELMNQDWEFGDGSPIEMAWRRSSEYAYAEFLVAMLSKPFKVFDNYVKEIDSIVEYYLKREGTNLNTVTNTRSKYTFKLGSKLGGFVNNLKVFSEKLSLSQSEFTEIPKDNFKLKVHAGEANRSESFSAIVLEKVSLDAAHPVYSLADTHLYNEGDIVYNNNDNKYYRRKGTSQSTKEAQGNITFDYDRWVLISQPKTKKFGYRIHGYDDFNPVFFAMDWDKTSGEASWSTLGDPANLEVWTGGSFYRLDQYVQYNNKPYVAVNEHTASTSFDTDIENWKLLSSWPRTNQTTANGYKKFLPDQVKNFNYGDILYSLEDVALLLLGYQEYLKIIGWDFTDIADDGEVVDFENLLKKFLDWSSEVHVPGDFITLTPILTSGRFKTPYGVASVARDTNKNFYRVVDSSGRKIPDSAIKFNTDGDGITFQSTLPVYGMKIDIQDVEHAIIVDREDSYGDTIYDPFLHNRNLRLLIDCNRTADWDGTLSVDGYLIYDNELVPNLETMVEESKHYRDTLVDQSLRNVNELKASQIGFFPRTYLTNHYVERESQLEFFKGFLAGKGTESAINRIVNFNSNFEDVKHSDIWALKLSDYGYINSDLSESVDVQTNTILSDPHVVRFTDIKNKFTLRNKKRTTAIKTSGFVDINDVNYVVKNEDILETTTSEGFFEGDIAWVRFDSERDWDVRRLSEVSEIAYIGETEDSQLYIALTNEIDITDPVYLKITSVDIDPQINGYFTLVDEGTREVDGVTVYEYLVFDMSYEPLIVEIDDSTSNSVYVPTSNQIGVEAIGSVSNPVINDGDILEINNEIFTYTPGSGSSAGITIGGASATPEPIVSQGEQGRIVVYGSTGLILNNDTIIDFDGTSVTGSLALTSDDGDKITIDGTEVTIQYSSQQSITATSSITTSSPITTGDTLTLSSTGETTQQVTIEDIEVVGTISNPTITSTKQAMINGVSVSFNVPAPVTGSNSSETQTGLSTPISSITLQNTTNFLPGDITVDNGVDAPYTLTSSDYSYSNGTITLNTPIADGQVDDDGDPLTPLVDQDGLADVTIELIAQPVAQSLQLNDIVTIINSSSAPISATSNASNQLILNTSESILSMTGSVLQDMGVSTGSSYSSSKLERLAEDIDALSFVSADINSNQQLRITTLNDDLTLGGSAFTDMGFPGNTFDATTDPTPTSVADQINAMSIPNISAKAVGDKIKIQSSSNDLAVAEVTAGAMFRLGFTTTTATVDSVQTIADNINEALQDVPNTQAQVSNRQILITSDQSSIAISNVSGNPWDDMGISEGTYTNVSTGNNSAADFRDQINSTSTSITVSLSSDGRMVFTSSGTSMTFGDTAQSVLDAIGLFREYTSVTSNSNFKIMRWKSVRWTPNYNGATFAEFYDALGLNDTSKIWVDDYEFTGKWAILERDQVGNLVAINRQSDEVDTDLIKRLIVKDGENFYNYQLHDPLNLRISGDIMKDIDYVDWNDPSKYDESFSSDIWLQEHLGDIWWDTTNTRYYRYNDFGDANGIQDEDYTKRYWGKLVPESDIVIKQWVVNNKVPTGISWFNQETFFNSETNKEETRYYYWTTLGTLPRYSKTYSIDEIRMMLMSGTTVNKFLPIKQDRVVMSNRSAFDNDNISVTIEYDIQDVFDYKHVDWELVSKDNSRKIPEQYMQGMINSVATRSIENFVQHKVTSDDIKGYGTEYKNDFLFGKGVNDIALSVNHQFVDTDEFTLNNDTITINNNFFVKENDIIRVYTLASVDNWFKNIIDARSNFESIMNGHFNRVLLEAKYKFYSDFIKPGQLAINSGTWAISEDFDVIENFDYLSLSRNIDMIGLRRKGVTSIKVELPEYDEFYFEYDGNFRLVHRTNSSLNVSFTDIVTPVNSEVFQGYYQNLIAVQVHELMNMLKNYGDPKFVKEIFFGMIDYMHTEKNYPDWIFKTSYFDLTMFNKTLRQYAIYQRDTYQDTIDYIVEAKPYHAKIREVERIYPSRETVSTDVGEVSLMEMILKFGEWSRYDTDVLDSGIEPDTTHNNTKDAGLEVEGEVVDQSDATYEQGGLLRRFYTPTNDAGGYDTGFFKTKALESSIVKVTTFTDKDRTTIDTVDFYVYDYQGRAYILTVDKTDTLTSFDGQSLVVDHKSYFKKATEKSKRLIAIENDSGSVEFMMYADKDEYTLSISDRSLYNGLGMKTSTTGNKIYTFKSPKRIVDV